MRILLIEDQETLSNIYNTRIRMNHELHLTIEEEYTQYKEYDLYILDVDTKGNKGIKEVVLDIRKHTDNPVWVLSNYKKPYIENKLEGVQVDKILEKLEILPLELQSLIEELCTT